MHVLARSQSVQIYIFTLRARVVRYCAVFAFVLFVVALARRSVHQDVRGQRFGLSGTILVFNANPAFMYIQVAG